MTLNHLQKNPGLSGKSIRHATITLIGLLVFFGTIGSAVALTATGTASTAGAQTPEHPLRSTLERAGAQCGVPATTLLPEPPAVAAQRLPHSQVVHGDKNIRWVWLGSPTTRYDHAALGSNVLAGSLHALVVNGAGLAREVVYRLPGNRVFEDLVPRLVDLDGDGRDEIMLVESDVTQGSALVVLSVPHADQDWTVMARSPFAGTAFRWLNPVGMADFDGDGHEDIASVTTPHIGGVLTLYHFRPPQLVPYARWRDVSNHRYGQQEQQLAVIVAQPDKRAVVIVPTLQYGALQAVHWTPAGRFETLTEPYRLAAQVRRMTPLPDGGCLLLDDASWWRVRLVS